MPGHPDTLAPNESQPFDPCAHPSMMKYSKTQRVASALAYATVLTIGIGLSPATYADQTRLEQLLATVPAGGWVQVSTTTFSSAWPTGSVAVPNAGTSPKAVVSAWSSVAWDSTHDQLIAWGGGHANYQGNEVYLWNAATGAWSLGSLPSRLYNGGAANFYVVDSAAPQSAHTYDNNLYLPVNNLFMTLGGAAYNTGGNFATATCTADFSCTNVTRAGPWMWDPEKADSTKVGGTTGSGYDPSTVGGNMWFNRAASLVGTQGPSYQEGAAANRVEVISGVPTDVVYLTSDSQGSGFPGLYRYVVGDVRNGGVDSISKIGFTTSTAIGQGAAALDNTHNLFIRTTDFSGTFAGASQPDLAVWMLSRMGTPSSNLDIAVRLVNTDGSDFTMSVDYGLDFDPVSGLLVLYDGANLGRVWYAQPVFGSGGVPLSTWTVTSFATTSGTAPSGSYPTGVLGKWQYAADLGAFIALDQYSTSTGDASVWLYKPMTSMVPEPGRATTILLGMALLAYIFFGRSRTMPSDVNAPQ